MYWSGEHETFLPAPDSNDGSTQDSDKKEDKKDKVKTAKRIAKDMEKWAKTLNQRKDAAKSNQIPANQPAQSIALTKINICSNKNVNSDQNNAGAEDIAFSMLNKRDGNSSSASQSTMLPMTVSNLDQNDEPPPPGSKPLSTKEGNMGLAGLANYNSDSDEDTSSASRSGGNEEKLTDWIKLACLLCQRQFPSNEKLIK